MQQPATPATAAKDEATKRFLARYQRAKEKRDRVAPVIDECYEFGLPLRERPYSSGEDYRARTERLFDGTAPSLVQDLASQMLDDVWPADAKPFELKAGKDVPPAEREQVNLALQEVTEEIIETINNSNFRAEAHEALMDWTIATGILLADEGDAIEPVRFRALPLAEAMPDTGPFENIDALFRPVECRAGDVKIRWPRAQLSEQLKEITEKRPDEKLQFVEGSERDWSVKGTETWRYRCVWIEKAETIDEGTFQGDGSKPFIDFSFMRVAREVIGRGPLQIALPDIKTLNLAKQFMLEAADLELGGIWLYDDDGSINPDTITIAPRTLIPRNPDSKGLERVNGAGNFNLGDLIVKDLQAQIRMTMLGDDLGPVQNTPMSATEVLERTANRARRRAGPYTRLIVGLLFQTVRRVAYILRKQGRIKLPAIDGRTIVFRPLSPLTRAQAQDEILRHDRFLEMANARVGPQQTALFVDSNRYLEFLADRFGVAQKVIRPAADRSALSAAIAALSALPNDQGMAA